MGLHAKTSAAALRTSFAVLGLPFRRVLQEYEESQWCSGEELRELARHRLSVVLASASMNPFYRGLYGDAIHGATDFRDFEDLSQLPVLEKNRVGDLARSLKKRRGLGQRRTAGTSGIPTVVLADKAAQAAILGARYRCYRWYGLELGSREARFWGRPIVRESLLARWKRSLLNRIPFDYRHVEPGRVGETLRMLNESHAEYLYGYASLIKRFCTALSERGLSPAPGLKAAILTAEAATRSERDWMSGVLGCPVVDEYGCSEVDMISFSCPAGGRHVMAENVYLETMPTQGSSDSQELLVTDLVNTAMPMIRYRLGDAVTLSDQACSCGRGLPLIQEVAGRSQRQYVRTPDGRRVHANPFPYFMEQKQAEGVPIRQFQIRQQAIDLIEVFFVLEDSPRYGAALERELQEMVAKYYGSAMHCMAVWVDSIAAKPGFKYEYFLELPEDLLNKPHGPAARRPAGD